MEQRRTLCSGVLTAAVDARRLGVRSALNKSFLQGAGSRSWGVATRLAFLAGDQGYVDEAIAILRGLADAGDPMAEYQLAKLRPAVDE